MTHTGFTENDTIYFFRFDLLHFPLPLISYTAVLDFYSILTYLLIKANVLTGPPDIDEEGNEVSYMFF